MKYFYFNLSSFQLNIRENFTLMSPTVPRYFVQATNDWERREGERENHFRTFLECWQMWQRQSSLDDRAWKALIFHFHRFHVIPKSFTIFLLFSCVDEHFWIFHVCFFRWVSTTLIVIVMTRDIRTQWSSKGTCCSWCIVMNVKIAKNNRQLKEIECD